MKCLAVNTATKILSVALLDDDRVLHLYQTAETRDQGNLLLRHIRAGLDKNGLTFDDLDLLAVTTGPGSFTGIRIGLAAVRGIALAANKPVTGVSSFDMFAVPGVNNLVAVESWRDEPYFRLVGADGRVLISPVNEMPEVFAARLPDMSLTVSGDAAEKIMPILPPGTILHKPEANAVRVAQVAVNSWNPEEFPIRPTPFYLRPADITLPRASNP